MTSYPSGGIPYHTLGEQMRAIGDAGGDPHRVEPDRLGKVDQSSEAAKTAAIDIA